MGLTLLPAFSQSPEKEEVQSDEPILKVEKGGYWLYQVNVTTPIPLGKALTSTPLKKDGKFQYFYDEKRVYQGEGRVAGLTEVVGSLEVYLEGKAEFREIQYVGFKPDGYWSYGALVKSSNEKTSRVLLKTPMPLILKKGKPGSQWSWKANELTFEFRVIGLEEVIVPAGQYKAVKIQIDQSDKGLPKKLRHYWFVEDIGIVKEQEESYLPNKMIVKKVWELKEVQLQAPSS